MPLNPGTFKDEKIDHVYGDGEAGWLRCRREIDESIRRHTPLVDPVDGFDRGEDYAPMWEDE